MKAILINATAKTVTEVDIDKSKYGQHSCQPYYDLIGEECNMIQIATELPNGDTIFVDEESLLRDSMYTRGWFDVDAHQPFCGSGVVVGTDEETGETIDCKSTVEEIRAKVKFLTYEAAAALYCE